MLALRLYEARAADHTFRRSVEVGSQGIAPLEGSEKRSCEFRELHLATHPKCG